MMHPPSVTSRVVGVVVLEDTDARGLADQVTEMEAAGYYHFCPPVQVSEVGSSGRCCLHYHATMVRLADR